MSWSTTGCSTTSRAGSRCRSALVELGALLAIAAALGIAAPLGPALVFFAGRWLAAQLLGHAGFPLLRSRYAEDGGELGRLGRVAAVAVVLAFGGAAATTRGRSCRRSSTSPPASTRGRS